MLASLRKALRRAGDPLKATAMQAYMKSAMPYHGVPTLLLRQILNRNFAELQFPTAAHWQAQVLDLWRNARFREERYAPARAPLSNVSQDVVVEQVRRREFFLRKAIGWALRQCAWTDPAEIKRYVWLNHARLSPLSCREALKNMG